MPHLTDLQPYLDGGTVPGGTRRNWSAFGSRILMAGGGAVPDPVWQVLADPQTNGGLLISVEPDSAAQVQEILRAHGAHAEPIGRIVGSGGVGDCGRVTLREG